LGVAKIKSMYWQQCFFLASVLVSQQVAQQSVQPTGGILRRFRAFFWLWAFPALEASLVPPTSG